METTYDVKVYKILTYKGARKTTYTVRWAVAGRSLGSAGVSRSPRSPLLRGSVPN